MTTTFTYDENLFSDFYKDVNGFRPKGHPFYSATPEGKQAIWDQLMADHDAEMDEYHSSQDRNVEDFEAAVKRTMEAGASDYSVAVRWMLQAEDETDVDYLEYLYDLPYGYLANYR